MLGSPNIHQGAVGVKGKNREETEGAHDPRIG
jgi:hypothetical protein